MPRDPAEVIARVLKVVPETEISLRLQLEALAADSWFFPPEGKHPVWAQLRNIMLRRFPEPVEGWPAEASAIICGEREP
jgi:hypothetical protein